MIDDLDFTTPESRRFWRLFASADFDPLTALAAGSMAAGGAINAFSTLAGGGAAAKIGAAQQRAAQFQAAQLKDNAAGEVAAAGRQAQDVTTKANLLRSSAVADSAAGGVVSTSGSAVTNQAQIAGRGNYEAALDVFNGANRATGLLNQATATQYQGLLEEQEGQFQKKASTLSAVGTLAGAGGSIFKALGGGMPGASGGSGGGAAPTFSSATPGVDWG